MSLTEFWKRINSISTPFGGISWDNDIEKRSLKDIETTDIPFNYSFEYVKTLVDRFFGEETPFIVVQYGSAVLNQHYNDEDYCIILFRNDDLEFPITAKLGHTEKSWLRCENSIDLSFREYTSFMLSLIIGRPYDISVAHDGKVINSYKVNTNYFEWARALKDNILISSKDLARFLKENDLKQSFDIFEEAIVEKNIGKLVFVAYQISSLYIQIREILKMPIQIYSEDIYPLSKSSILLDKLERENEKDFFNTVVGYIKRKNRPGAPSELIENAREFFYTFDKEIQNV